MPISPPERAAAGILAVEAVAILALAGWEIVALVSGDTEAVVSSIALIVLTVIGAASVGAFALAVSRGQSWGRSGGVVTQLLMLAVAIGALTGPAPSVPFALALAVPAVIAFAILVIAARRAGGRRDGVDRDGGDVAA